MPVNKNALIRYHVLDRCLGNWGRRYYIEDLVEACNEALYQYNGETKADCGVKKRQVQEDLKFIESEEGYQMMIDAIRDGHRKYYRYHKRGMSIKDRPINQEEIELMHDALVLMQRFSGVPQFAWLDGLAKQLDATSRFGKDSASVVSFQQNAYLKGMDDWYKPLFDCIINKRVVEITYRPFGKEAKKITVCPYHLKQYNNRWYLISRRIGAENMSNYAIDRIEDVRETSQKYEPLDEGFSFDEYFEDVVGVSITDSSVEEVVLRVSDNAIGYIMTKPLHESQSSVPQKTDDGRWELSIKVKDNYELQSLLRSFGSSIEVMSPAKLRREMIDNARNILKLYGE